MKVFNVYICLFISVTLYGFVRTQNDTDTDETVEDDTPRFSNETLNALEGLRNGWHRKGRRLTPPFKPTPEQQAWWDSLGGGGGALPNTDTESRKKRQTEWWSQPMERKEYRQLTREERIRFHAGIRSMKSNMIGSRSEYDMFVEFHQSQNSPGAHFGAAFLPWHREYLFRFELALQIHCPTCTLPYWDSRLDQRLPNPQHSIIWAPNFLGNSQGVVTTGPFANNWEVLPRCRRGGATGIVRNEGRRRQNDALYEDRDVALALTKTSYEDLVIPNTFEITHGGPHVYVGGQMVDIICSPSDPAFFLHHSMVDHIWEHVRKNAQTTDLENEYPQPTDTNLIGGRVHGKYSPMAPFTWLENWNGNSRFYESFYSYSDFQESCQRASDCDSPYLWCFRNRCTSKVRRNGDCTGFPQTSDPCQCGMCRSNRCTATTQDEIAMCNN